MDPGTHRYRCRISPALSPDVGDSSTGNAGLVNVVCCTWCSDRTGGDLGLLEVVSLIMGPLNIAVLPDVYQIGKSLRQFI